MVIVKRFCILFIVVLLSACGGSTPQKAAKGSTITDQDVRMATANGSLEQLYNRLAGDLSGKSPEKYSADYSRLNNMGLDLSKILSQRVIDSLNTKRDPSGAIPTSALASAEEQISPMKRWDMPSWQTVSNTISKEKKNTRDVIADLELQLAGLSKRKLRKKLDVLKSLEKVTSRPEYLRSRSELLDELQDQLNEAKAKNEFTEDLKDKLDVIMQERPDAIELKDLKIIIDTNLFKSKFWNALGNDNPQKAYDIFMAMSESDDFQAILSELGNTSKKMAAYFVALGEEALKNNALSEAYQWFTNSREVKKRLGFKKLSSPEEKPFLEKLHKLHDHANNQELPEIGLGYLMIIKEIDPTYPNLRRLARNSNQLVLQNAINKVSTTTFSSPNDGHEFGTTITSKVTQFLFEKIPNDVRIIEREQYEAILREQKLKQLSGKKGETLMSVDYLITGSVLESKVETVESKGRKTVRVVTGRKTLDNPAYAQWAKLDKEKREKVPAPPTTIQEEIKENVTVNITQHRKVGIMSVSYRLIDAGTGKVIYPDSVTLSKEFSDTSQEGIELGDYSIPFKLADLPSDIVILNNLAAKISDSIGENLIAKLRDPEDNYEKKASIEAEEQNYIEAGTNIAYAYALHTQKDKPTKELASRLKAYSIATGLEDRLSDSPKPATPTQQPTPEKVIEKAVEVTPTPKKAEPKPIEKATQAPAAEPEAKPVTTPTAPTTTEKPKTITTKPASVQPAKAKTPNNEPKSKQGSDDKAAITSEDSAVTATSNAPTAEEVKPDSAVMEEKEASVE